MVQNALSTAVGLSLLTTSILIGSSLSVKAATLTINLSDQTNSNTQDYPTIQVTLDDTLNLGKVTATATVVPGATGYIGDLRGVYFNLPSNISNLQINAVSGGPLTATSTNGDFSSFSNSASLQGIDQSFNIGAEIGKQGIAKGDDYQTTTFTIAGDGLTLNAFTSQSIGVRLMSVGSPTGNRDLSSKTLGTVPPIVTPPTDPKPPVDPNPPSDKPPVDPNPPSDPVSVPEPATVAGLGLVAAALGISRRRQSPKKA